MRTCCFTTFVALLTVAAPIARADDRTHRQAAEDLLRVAGVEKSMQTAIDQMVAIQSKQPALAPHKEVLKKFYMKYLSFEALKDDLVAIYTKEFTEAELRQIVAFYKSPAGKKIAERGPALMAKCMQLGADTARKHQDELKQMIEEEAKKQKDKQ